MVLTQTQLALFLKSWSGLMPNKNMKIVVLGNMYFAGRRWWSRYWERRRHSDKDAVFLVWRCCSVDHLTARACAKSGWVCRSLKGVFVRKMSGINSWQNVNFSSFVGHMVFRLLLGLRSVNQPKTNVPETCSVPAIRVDADDPDSGLKTKLALLKFRKKVKWRRLDRITHSETLSLVIRTQYCQGSKG